MTTLSLCRAAAQADPNVLNLGGLVNALLMSTPKAAALPPDVVTEIESLLASGFRAEPQSQELTRTQCRYAMRQNLLGLLDRCAEHLRRIASDDHFTIFVSFIVAGSKGEWGEVEDWIARARAANASPQLIASMESTFRATRPFWWLWLRAAPWVVGGWAAVMSLLVAVGMALSHATLRYAEGLASSTSTSITRPTLRRLYAAVLVFACAFYYASLPLVLAAVTVVAGAVI